MVEERGEKAIDEERRGVKVEVSKGKHS